MSDEYVAGAIVGSLLMGAVLGLLPLILGNKRGKKGLAIGGFFACVGGSLILGLLLSIPACITFTVIILASSKKSTAYTPNPQPPVNPPNPTIRPNPPIQPAAPKCVQCGNQLTQDQAFCPRCGTQQAKEAKPVYCSSCGNSIAPGELFCNKCGTKAAH